MPGAKEIYFELLFWKMLISNVGVPLQIYIDVNPGMDN